MEGVHEVGVSLAHEEGLVRYDPAQLDEDELRRTLEQLGYTYRDPEKLRSFEEEKRELRITRNRLIVAGVLAGITAVLMLLGMEPFRTVLEHPFLMWVMLALALKTMFVAAWFVKKMAWASLRRGIFNQHVLMELGAFAGLAGGLLGMFVSPQFPAGHFFAVAVFITAYHILSDYVSRLVRTRSSQAVRQLMDLQPDTARVIRDGREIEVPVGEVEVGDRVRIRPGESVPVDGEVTEGASAVNEALVTGEPIPSEKTPDDEVIGGSINQTGSLVVRVTRVGEESFLSQVARSIEESRALKPGVLQLADMVLEWFVPGVLLVAAGGFLAWTVGPLLFGLPPNFFRATFAALAVLVLGYPCALGMATPLAMIRGGGEAAGPGGSLCVRAKPSRSWVRSGPSCWTRPERSPAAGRPSGPWWALGGATKGRSWRPRHRRRPRASIPWPAPSRTQPGRAGSTCRIPKDFEVIPEGASKPRSRKPGCWSASRASSKPRASNWPRPGTTSKSWKRRGSRWSG